MNTSSLQRADRRDLPRIACLAVAIASLVGLCLSAEAADRYATLAQPVRLHAGDALVGALPMTQPIHVEVALALRDREGLDAFLGQKAIARPMSSESFLALHAPTAAQAQAVADYLTGMGFRHVAIAPNRLLVSADGTAANARAAFATRFAQVRTREGRIAYANTDAVRLPAALSGTVIAVLGLQNVHVAHTLAMPPSRSGGVKPQAVTGHPPSDFESIYGASGAPAASGIAVGLIVTGNLTHAKNDLVAYTTANGVPAVTTQTVHTNGTSTDTSRTAEWDLDSQAILGMAGGKLGKLIFYDVPDGSNANLVADFNAAVTANATKVLAVSMAECETDAGPAGDNSAAAADEIFAAADAQGQTFMIANGDTGADECGNGGTTPSWPADSPYVLAVAGTTYDATAGTTVWNTLGQPDGGATGGSESTFEPKPSWQTWWTGSHRGVADFAMDADPNSGAIVYVNGVQQQLGGTGLAASILAGLTARVLQNNQVAHPTTALGFQGTLNSLAGGSGDIQVGNNGGEQATSGYDLASGLGLVNYGVVLHNQWASRTHCCHVAPNAAFDYTPAGLTATFEDQSATFDNARIVKQTWHFGDGTSSTQSAPTHTYAAAGKYSVSESVTDGVGAASSVTIPVTVATSGPLQLLGDTGFEPTSNNPWDFPSSLEQVCNSSTYQPHQGQCLVVLPANPGGGLPQGLDYIQRMIAIPAGKSVATLTFSLHVVTSGSPPFTTEDQLHVDLLNPAGTIIGNPKTYSYLDASPDYVTRTVDLSKFIGQAVTLQFRDVYKDFTIHYEIDEVTLTVQ